MDVNASRFIDYLLSNALPLFDCSREDLSRVLTKQQNLANIQKFMSDSQSVVLQLSRETTELGDASTFTYCVDLEVSYKGPKSSVISFVKRPGFQGIGPFCDAPIEGQDESEESKKEHLLKHFGGHLMVMTLGFMDAEHSPFQLIHQYLNQVVIPLTKTFFTEGASKTTDDGGVDGHHADEGFGESNTSSSAANQAMLANVRSRTLELSLALQAVQQSVDIPEVHLFIDPEIMDVCVKSKTEGKRASVDDFKDRMQDQSFLSRVSQAVRKWRQETLRVCELDRDVTSGNASAEVAFWVGKQKALQHLDAQLSTPEVDLIVDILRLGKTFGPAMVMETRSAVKSALATATNYCTLLEDTAVDKLVAATDLVQLSHAVSKIFASLKRIRSSQYPVTKAIQLVEAISRDLTDQIQKICPASRLMSADMETFNQLISQCVDVCKVFDDEVQDLRDVLRTINKNNAVRHASKFNLAYTDLAARLKEIEVFRKAHQTFRDIVSKVVADKNPQQNSSSTNPNKASGKDSIDSGIPNQTPSQQQQPAAVATTNNSNIAGELSIMREVAAAFRVVAAIDILDVSKAGSEAWESARRSYHHRIDRIEGIIAARLRETLGNAKTTASKFRVFERYSGLLSRPRIRGAVQEYQSVLVDEISKTISDLQQKFRKSYEVTAAAQFSQLRDFPAASGSILWSRQIERQLENCLVRLSSVLGRSWEAHADGHRLKQEVESIKKKLPHVNTTVTDFINYVKTLSATSTSSSVSGQPDDFRVFKVVPKTKTVSGIPQTVYELGINFDPRAVAVFKECRVITNALNERVPFSTRTAATEAKLRYPFAVALQDAVRTFMQTCSLVAGGPLSPLLSASEDQIRQSIMSNIDRKWDYEKLESFAKDFSENVFKFHVFTQNLIDASALIEADVRALATVPLSQAQASAQKAQEMNRKRENSRQLGRTQKRVGKNIISSNVVDLDDDDELEHSDKLNNQVDDTLNTLIARIQDRIDQLSIKDYSNLSVWVAQLDKKVERTLTERAQELIKTWVAEFEVWPNRGSIFIQESSVLELRTNEDNEISISPPVESAAQTWYSSFHETISSILGLPRLDANRFDHSKLGGANSGDNSSSTRGTYLDLVNKLSASDLKKGYNAIDNIISRTQNFVTTWLNYQSLWECTPGTVTSELADDDVESWTRFLNEVRTSRSFIDHGDAQQSFGPVIVDTRFVQSRILSKFDQWHRDTTSLYAQKVGEQITNLYSEVQKTRFNLEKLNTEGAVGDVAAFISSVQNAKKNTAQWTRHIELLRQSQRLLEKQRFQFPPKWMNIARVDGEWEALQQILERRATTMEQHIPSLRKQVTHEDRQMQIKIKLALTEWSTSKPLQGNVKPQIAMDTLQMYEQRFNKLKDEKSKLEQAKKALDLDSGGPDQLTIVLEELDSLRSVWQELASVVAQLDALKDIPWSSVVPKFVRRGLENVASALKNLPARLRQFEAFDQTQEVVQRYSKTCGLLTALRSDSVRERHWTQILQKLHLPSGSMHDLSLGALWDCDLITHEKSLNEIVSHATNEAALEDFFKDVRACWQDYELQLVNFKSRVKLIRGWNEVLGQLDEHLASLSSMKASAYIRVFEEEHSGWETRLTRLRLLLEDWMEVQRRWVYLEGVFFGSADIQQQLASEHSRFKQIDADFLSIMKRVALKPKILEVASTEGLHKQLERLSDQLTKIQKVLGEFLEKQRVQFARFFFVGDDDLLDMIGNSRDPLIAQRHLSKLFAGIAGFHLEGANDSSNQAQTALKDEIYGLRSREAEIVNFPVAIRISEDPSIHGWLGKVEKSMIIALKSSLLQAIRDYNSIPQDEFAKGGAITWALNQPAQVATLAVQIAWTQACEEALDSTGDIEKVEQTALTILGHLAERVLSPSIVGSNRLKLEQLVTVLVHQRDTTRSLRSMKMNSKENLKKNGGLGSSAFEWLQMMRLYITHSNSALASAAQKNNDFLALAEQSDLYCRMADGSFEYGFEYMGVQERLVQTPLTDRCFLTLTQALHMRLGGNPFGPAGTGKTESVKALGNQLGRFTLVFCCDEAFDLLAMNRIFVGLCQVGAWGCFDEFNRLEEGILSAVSEQILVIQRGLKERQNNILLDNRNINLSPHVGIFVTMNPGYAGRSQLPDNLKLLFREMAMVKPDKELIGQVTLFSQGFKTAERLASKVVSLFDLCQDQLSAQPHYDFGLRSLKSVLCAAGALKRRELQQNESSPSEASEELPVEMAEQNLILRAVCDTLVPRLIASDVILLKSLIQGVFPGSDLVSVDEKRLMAEVRRLCAVRHLEDSPAFMEKVAQLFAIQRLNHGVMLVGPVGAGKSSTWKVLLDAMSAVDGVKGEAYVIDPKAVMKEQLYGKLDATTLEWTNGIFTEVLRKVLNSTRGEKDKRHWIVFDGDVDPEWAENLNSVLDDNKLLTLPNGERLSIPNNVRLLFEVDSLKHATLATVSRCGMIWFSDDVVTPPMLYKHHIHRLMNGGNNLDETPAAASAAASTLPPSTTSHSSGSHGAVNNEESAEGNNNASSNNRQQQTNSKESQVSAEIAALRYAFANALMPFFEASGLVDRVLNFASNLDHVMIFTRIRVVEALFSLIRKGARKVFDHNSDNPDFPIEGSKLEGTISKWLLFSLTWAVGGSLNLAQRAVLCSKIAEIAKSFEGVSHLQLPSNLSDGSEITLLDYEVSFDDNEWRLWKNRVVATEVDAAGIADANTVVTTLDTLRHRAVLQGWLEERRPFLLCGPPGSGKSMTLNSTLKSMAGIDLASLNFSSGSTPDLILKTFDHYCEYVKTSHGIILRPTNPGRWLVVFCDEINLPTPDKYGTQKAISFLRQLTEAGGFWRPSDRQWIKLERIQFVGACNPPTDAGRSPMTDRFLRHAPLLFVDFPARDSLEQIYGAFMGGMTKNIPDLYACSRQITKAMVEFYIRSQRRFTVDQQPHYLFSPRELSRWKVAIAEFLNGAAACLHRPTLREFARLLVHEGLRIFTDRLVEKEERKWSEENLDEVTMSHLPQLDSNALSRPILFSFQNPEAPGFYSEMDFAQLRTVVHEKLPSFYEDMPSVRLVLFDEALEHISRIDRVLRQPLGHLLLVGASGAGKTVLSRFVASINDMDVFQVRPGRGYDTTQFEIDLRVVMKQAGVKEKRIAFIFDESNALGPAFLERMNALLASGEVPGLFEGDELNSLMAECRAAFGTASEGASDDSELFRKFTSLVQRNLHIVFTMNPANPEFVNRQATSPALFNRCVVDWFGDWSSSALQMVGCELSKDVPMEATVLTRDVSGAANNEEEAELLRREIFAKALVEIHRSVTVTNSNLSRAAKRFNYVTPRDFMDLLKHTSKLFLSKRQNIHEQLHHLVNGLQKLKETEEEVSGLQVQLAQKEKELATKERDADQKMSLMVKSKSEAEKQKAINEHIVIKLDEKSKDIGVRSRVVKDQLAEVEPMVEKAKNAVKSLERKHFVEMTSVNTPTPLVKNVLEALLILRRDFKETPTWDEIRRELRGSLPSEILNESENDAAKIIPDKVVARLQNEYVSNWNMDLVKRASSVAEILAEWIKSKLLYQTMLSQVKPLTQEIETLEAEKNKLVVELSAAENLIKQLEHEIDGFKRDFSELIAQAETIKQEKKGVEAKVDRSKRLLTNLTSEKSRWADTAESLKQSEGALLGTSILAGAFCTYLGFFDQALRAQLISRWKKILEDNFIRLSVDDRHSTSDESPDQMMEFLSSPQERILWSTHGLPNDNLAIENAAILSKFNRYPLVLDPSGQAISYLKSLYSDQKLLVTSFSDPGMLRDLENCVRFGLPAIIQGVGSKIDPVLNSLMSFEIKSNNGRQLTYVGDKEVDFNKNFRLFLTTSDGAANFSPDLASRVTFVNFTVTPSSLQNQCLSMALKSERPDVEKRREHVLKLRGEFQMKIRDLEAGLLRILADSEGNLLENERVVASLENLKNEASHVANEAAKTDEIIAEVNATSATYDPLARAAALIFFTCEKLEDVNGMYRQNLSSFLSTFSATLAGDSKALPSTPAGASVVSLASVAQNDFRSRLAVIFDRLFAICFFRLSKGLLEQDKLVLAIRIAQIKLQVNAPLPPNGLAAEHSPPGILSLDDLNLLLSGTASSRVAVGKSDVPPVDEIIRRLQSISSSWTAQQGAALHSFASSHKFGVKLLNSILTNDSIWNSVLAAPNPELLFMSESQQKIQPLVDLVNKDHEGTAQRRLMVAMIMKSVRPDRVADSLKLLVLTVLGPRFLELSNEAGINIGEIILHECSSISPLLLVSAPGFDLCTKVTDCSSNLGRGANLLHSLAMGEKATELVALDLVRAHASDPAGHWIILKNVHLCKKWLCDLDAAIRKMKNLSPHFRLILTTERDIARSLPPSILCQAVRIVSEPPSGIKASMLRSYSTALSSKIVDREPVERSRLHFLLALLHAINLERLRFSPLGWTKAYEFSDADLHCAVGAIDAWVDKTAGISELNGIRSQGPSNIDVARIPWTALRTVIRQVVYGGRVDNPYDMRTLTALIDQIFRPESFEPNALLSVSSSSDESSLALRGPESARKRDHFLSWIDSLPDSSKQPLSWLGLPAFAERLPREKQGVETLANLLLTQIQDDSGFASSKDNGPTDKKVPSATTDITIESDASNAQSKGGEWLASVLSKVEFLSLALPANLTPFPTLPASMVSSNPMAAVCEPLWRCFAREAGVCMRVLRSVHNDLSALKEICTGNSKMTNEARAVATALSHEITPSTWSKEYLMPNTISASGWVSDFAARCKSIQSLANRLVASLASGGGASAVVSASEILRRGLRASHLLYPEAFLTATRQCEALFRKVSLESLQLVVDLNGFSDPVLASALAKVNPNCGKFDFEWSHLTLEGAVWSSKNKRLGVTDSLMSELPAVTFRWVSVEEANIINSVEDDKTEALLEIPLYLNGQRRFIVSSITMKADAHVPARLWQQRNICISIWSQNAL